MHIYILCETFQNLAEVGIRKNAQVHARESGTPEWKLTKGEHSRQMQKCADQSLRADPLREFFLSGESRIIDETNIVRLKGSLPAKNVGHIPSRLPRCLVQFQDHRVLWNASVLLLKTDSCYRRLVLWCRFQWLNKKHLKFSFVAHHQYGKTNLRN